MDAVVERLRASKERVTNKEKVQGHAAGRKWATEDAEFDELQRLSESGYVDAGQRAWDAYRLIANDDPPNPVAVEEFWERVVGQPDPSDDLANAFVDGATEVFNEVEGHL